jgi:thiamine biosynthesis lipoprotein
MRWSAATAMLALALLLPVSAAGCAHTSPAPPAPAPTAAPPAPTPEPAPPPVAMAPPQPAEPFVPVRVALDAAAMGTKVTIAAYTSPAIDEAKLRAAISAALEEVRRLEGLMTTWREDSEVSRVTAGAGKAAVAVGPETLAVVEKSLWAARVSEGTFDITFEAMRGVWKFDEGAEARVPARAAVEQARRLIDWRKVSVDPVARTVKLEREGMRIGLGGIAKGFAVDAASRILDGAGIRSHFVQAGGDLFVRGRKPDGTAFKVGVRDPRGRSESDFFATLEVVDHAFSTAGDYERSFVKDGRRYHHIIDPRTGFPAEACRSVTVWAPDAFTADAIDDAVFILGPEKGLALVESVEGVGAVIVDRRNEVWVSRRLEGLVRRHRAPTDGI